MSIDARISAQPVRASAPVTAHPWFPGIVALWFAALFGLSSLALAAALLERIVLASGIDSVIAAAAPPLGQTARLLLALGLAGLGAVLGLLFGRRLAAPGAVAAPRRRDIVRTVSDDDAPAPRMGVRDRLARLTGHGDGPRDFDDLPRLRARDRHPDAPSRKPLSPADVMAGDVSAVEESVGEALRRRAASSETEYAPAPFSGPAPVPGDGWAAPGPFSAPAMPAEAARDADEPLELHLVAEPEPIVIEEAPVVFAAPAPFAAPVAPVAAIAAPAAVALVSSEPLREALNPQAIAEAPLDSLGVVQLTERLAIAMRVRRERDARRVEAEAAQVEEAPIVLPSLVAVRTPEPEPEAGREPESVAVFPEPAIARFAAPSAPLEMPQSFRTPLRFDDDDEHGDEDAAMPALARSLSLAPAMAAEQPAAEVEAPLPDEALARGLEILARRSGQPVVPEQHAKPSPEADQAELDAEALEDGYSSLLNLSRVPARNGAVRIEEPESDEIEPVVVFPGQAGASARALPGPFSAPPSPNSSPPAAPFGVHEAAAAPASATAKPRDPAETDRALKSALASLQRISGTR